jgi:hypothetical protein
MNTRMATPEKTRLIFPKDRNKTGVMAARAKLKLASEVRPSEIGQYIEWLSFSLRFKTPINITRMMAPKVR